MKRPPPPNDLDAERAVLGSAIHSLAAFDEIADTISAESFWHDGHRLIWQAIRGLVASGETPDVVTLKGVLRETGKLDRAGGTVYLAQLLEATPSVANVAAHAKVVSGLHKLRKLIDCCHRVAAEGYSVQSRNCDDFADQAQARVWEIVSSGMASDRLTNAADEIGPTFSHIEAIGQGDQSTSGSVLTGFKKLDEAVTGWFPGDLTTLAARPAMGKTGLALQLAFSQARSGRCALFFSLEMSTRQVMSRILAQDSNVDLNNMRKGKLDQMQWRRITDASTNIERIGRGFWVDDSASATVLDVSAKTRRVQSVCRQEGRPLSLVVVDYLQLLSPAEKSGSREQQVASMSRSLKRIARDLGVAVVMLSQLSRAVESRQDKRPVLSDLRESGAIEQDSDNVMFLYRPGYYERDSDSGDTELIVAKQRNGPTGTVPLEFFSGSASFGERIF